MDFGLETTTDQARKSKSTLKGEFESSPRNGDDPTIREQLIATLQDRIRKQKEKLSLYYRFYNLEMKSDDKSAGENNEAENGEISDSVEPTSRRGTNDSALESEVVQWKKQYDEVLKKMEIIDSDTKAMECLLTSTEFTKKQATKSSPEEKHPQQIETNIKPNNSQFEITEIINVLRKQYDKVETVLLKQNEKLETIVQKLNAELEQTKQKGMELERQLVLRSVDIIQITVTNPQLGNAVTVVTKQNDDVQPAVELLKSYIQERNPNLEICSLQMSSGQNVYERLAILERENKSLKERMLTLGPVSNGGTESPQTVGCNLTLDSSRGYDHTYDDSSIYEKLIADYEKTISLQDEEITNLKSTKNEFSELLKIVTAEKNRLSQQLKHVESQCDEAKINFHQMKIKNDDLMTQIEEYKTMKVPQPQINECVATDQHCTEKEEMIQKLEKELQEKNNDYDTLNEKYNRQKLTFTKELQTSLITTLTKILLDETANPSDKPERQQELTEILHRIQNESMDLKSTLLLMKKAVLKPYVEAEAHPMKSQLNLKVQSSPELPSNVDETIDDDLKLSTQVKSMVDVLIQPEPKPDLIDKQEIDHCMKMESKIDLGNSKIAEDIQINDEKLKDLNNPTQVQSPDRRNTTSFEIHSSDQFPKTLDRNLKSTSPHLTPQVSSEIIINSVRLNEATETSDHNWHNNIEVIERFCSELADLRKQIGDGTIPRQGKSDAVIEEEHFQETFEELQDKLQKLQVRISVENTRHKGLESQIQNLETRIAESEKRLLNGQDIKEMEQTLKDQFESTKAKLETELKDVRAKLEEKFNEQSTKSTQMSSVVKSLEIEEITSYKALMPQSMETKKVDLFCKTCNGLQLKNKERSPKIGASKKCTCSANISHHYKQQLKETIEKRTAGGPSK